MRPNAKTKWQTINTMLGRILGWRKAGIIEEIRIYPDKSAPAKQRKERCFNKKKI